MGRKGWMGSWVLAGMLVLMPRAEAAVWQAAGDGLAGENITVLGAAPDIPGTVWLGTRRGLFSSSNNGVSFQNVLPETSFSVRDIFLSAHGAEIYAATDQGLYQGRNGQAFARIFAGGADSLTADGQAVVEVNGTVYFASAKGLFYQRKGSPDWQRMPGALGHEAVYMLAASDAQVYAAGASTVYRLHADGTAEDILHLGQREGERPADEDVIEEGRRQILAMAVIPASPQRIMVVTAKAVVFSPDQGAHWHEGISTGLPVDQVRELFWQKETAGAETAEGDPFLGGRLWAATGAGIFAFDGRRWVAHYAGLSSSRFTTLRGNASWLFAAGDEGVYRLAVTGAAAVSGGPARLSSIPPEVLRREPDIRQVQRMAVAYADIHPDKIRAWQRQARLKAWVPAFSVGLDRASTDLYHWDTGGSPDYLQKGKEYMDWDVSLSWDLGDMIWSTDQTSIDSRAKLMTELREDILDQVTRLYYERRRLQMGIGEVQGVGDPRERDLRIEELTARIDGLTGGGFSRGLASSGAE